MSESIRIAGVAIRVDMLAKISPETIMRLALKTTQYYQKPGAEKEIKVILEERGLFNDISAEVGRRDPAELNSGESEPDNSKRKRRNRKSSKS